MLRRDEVVSSRPGILHRRLQHALRADGERQLNCRTGIGIPNLILGRNPAVPDIANDDSRLVNGDSRPEKPAVGLGDEAEQEVLGENNVAAERPRLPLREDHGPDRPLREPLEHRRDLQRRRAPPPPQPPAVAYDARKRKMRRRSFR